MSDELNILCDTQHTAEWFESRKGCLTASYVADALAKRKRGDAEMACRANYRLELAVERLTGKISERFVSDYMKRGAELEPLARAAYEMRTDQMVAQTGFILHPNVEWAGCSPDGLIGGDGLVELKAPARHTHAEYLVGRKVPEDYIPQMMWQMACCPGRQWNDFASFCPDFPEPLNLFVVRLPRNEDLIAAMEAEARVFVAEVEATVQSIKALYPVETEEHIPY